MSSSRPDANDRGGERVGGARAVFVAALGRKVKDAREVLGALEQDPSARTPREELRRRLHALGAGARLFRFDAMGRSLQEALALLDRGAMCSPGGLRAHDVGFIAKVLDDLPALAWAETAGHEPPPAGADESEAGRGPMPVSVLVIGGESLADGLTEDTRDRPRAFECERTEEMQTALGLARAYAPDLIVVDTDLPGATELVEALLDDPLTEPLPLVVVGTYSPDVASRFIALGATRSLAKPLGPELVRTTCEEILDAREGRAMRMTLGEPTLEQLAERLADELRRALIDSVDAPSRSRRVPLGEGSDVLGALWGAIARVQEIVFQRTHGAIRFAGNAPEGAVALAPWLHHEVPAADRAAVRSRGAGADVRLNGRRVVVADDDPGVTWFLSDLLRTAGCEVHEALDGLTALHLAHRVQPELIVSDILMPGLDGFALCRAVRRDVALRDTPVILLSWKEDLLQRVRELGASAAAYMRKESDSRAVLARVREVLRPRARLEMRLRGDGEIRGRLDGVTSRLLLDLVCLIRKDARVAVRDATNLYEIEIREGAPRNAMRTAADGTLQGGERVIASLLGVGAGRFAVAASTGAVRGELAGSLFDQLAQPIAAARGALEATTGAATMHVDRIAIDSAALEDYLRVTPDPSAAAIKKIAAGTSPRQMLLAGEIAPGLLEDLLADLAARGAIRAVRGSKGEDLLTPAVAAALAVLRGAPPASRSLPPNARSIADLRLHNEGGMRSLVGSETSSLPLPTAAAVAARSPASDSPLIAADADPVSLVNAAPRAPARAMEGTPDSRAPSSLEDALIRELSEQWTNFDRTRSPVPDPPPIVEPSELRKRSSNPPPLQTAPPFESDSADDHAEDQPRLHSIPSDAVVPASSSEDGLAVARVTPVSEPARGARRGRSLWAGPAVPPARAPGGTTPPVPGSHVRLGVLIAAALLLAAALSSVVIRWTASSGTDRIIQPVTGAVSGAGPLASVVGAHVAPGTSQGDTDQLPAGSEVPPGFGLLEIVAPPGATVRVDGAVAGSGPLVSAVAAPGAHEVRVEQAGREWRNAFEVRAGRATRVRRTAIP